MSIQVFPLFSLHLLYLQQKPYGISFFGCTIIDRHFLVAESVSRSLLERLDMTQSSQPLGTSFDAFQYDDFEKCVHILKVVT
ncbi:unnamed protein product [Haemonchus placei]|uniref:Secreted protein n=1 Tax=Haemonchus placei TaxID=6290 RepID=A0A0N4X248_HAEPC|nr:unnamed protein product [Haemonchus placei]